MSKTAEENSHDEHRCLRIKSNKQITEVFKESGRTNERTIYTQSDFSTPKSNSQEKTTPGLQSDKTTSNLFTHVQSFVFCLSLLQLVQVMGSGYGKSALTSIERRYRLNTFSIGVLQSCFPIGNLSVILFVSYFGSKWHRPRAIAVGSMVMALSSLISCLPQFLGERYNTELLQHVRYPSTKSKNIFNFTSTIGNRQLTDNDGFYLQLLNLQYVERNNDSLFLSTPGRTKTDQHVFVNDLFQRQPNGEVVNVVQNKSPSPQPAALSRLLAAENTKENYHINYVADDKNNSTYQNSILMAFNGSVRHQLCKPLTMPSIQWEFIQSHRMEKLSKQKNNEDDSFLYVFIAAGSVLKGIGHSPLHPLGMSFIDDFASGSNSAVYIGVISALSLLGPAFGFILGSLTANIWVDSGWVDTTNISINPQDSLWVGAWWMGYLITGCLLIVATIPFFAFPRVIDKEEENVNKKAVCFSRVKACLSDDENEDRKAVPGDCKDHYTECDNTEQHVDLVTRDDAIVEMTLGLRQDSNDVTSKSMDFEPNTRQLFPIDSETIHTNGSRSMCYCVDDVSSTFNGTKRMHYGRFCRSASTPAIHAAHLRRATRAFSLHPGDCVFDKKVLNSTLRNSPSNASMKDFAFTLKGLLQDPVFISITLGFVSLTSFLASSITFVSKYMETQFNLSASHANLLNGCVNLPMAVVGNLLGGWIIRNRNLTVKRTLNVVLASLFMTLIAVAFLLFWGCERDNIVGIGDSSLSSSSPCIKSCRCEDTYAPVCLSTLNITFRSPCHAGCTKMNVENGIQTFSECRCLVSQGLTNGILPNGSLNGEVHAGACPKLSCSDGLTVFVVVMGIASMTAGMSSTPSTLTILRVVPPSDKAFAIGIVFVFTRVLAWIPAPVYVGSAIDISCLLWIDSCQNKFTPTGRHHCELYDKRLLRQAFFGCTSLQLLLSSCFYGLALFLVTRRDKERGKLQPGSRCDHV